MEYRKLGKTGLNLSVVGFGGATLGSVFRKINEEEGKRAAQVAIELGINYFDTAPFYGTRQGETVMGEALQGHRNQVVLSTKLGRYDSNQFDFSAEHVPISVDESLRLLKTDYVDLLIAHDVEFGDLRQIAEETIPAMIKLKEQGKCRFIGFSGYPLRALTDLFSKVEVDFVLSYCHYCLYNTSLVDKLGPSVKSKGLGLINASPLALGLLTNYPPAEWHPAPQELKDAARKAADLCRSRGTELSFIGMQFALTNDMVTSTLSGIESVEQLKKNLSIFNSPIDKELLSNVQEIFEPVRGTSWPSGRAENN